MEHDLTAAHIVLIMFLSIIVIVFLGIYTGTKDKKAKKLPINENTNPFLLIVVGSTALSVIWLMFRPFKYASDEFWKIIKAVNDGYQLTFQEGYLSFAMIVVIFVFFMITWFFGSIAARCSKSLQQKLFDDA